MGRKRTPGLYFRGGIWHIDKHLNGQRICQSTGTASLAEAEQYLARISEQTRQASVYGVRPIRTFEQAAIKFVEENTHKRSLRNDISRLKGLMPWLRQERLDRIHMGALQPWIKHREAEGAAAGTINHGLKVIRRILNLAATEWVDEYGLTWLMHPAKIRLLPDRNKRKPYPLSWAEQEYFFSLLPDHLADMATFGVHTGCRDGEICKLKWEWEVQVPQMQTSLFVIPGKYVKNSDDRLVVLNHTAKALIDKVRGVNSEYVFTYKDKPITRIMNSAWLKAREKAKLPMFRVHDLKHTFGSRLREAGVSFEDRQDLLGHRSGRITTHYSAADLTQLIKAANSVAQRDQTKPELVLLKRSIM